MRMVLHFDNKTAFVELGNEYWQILQRMYDMGLWYSFGRTAERGTDLNIDLDFARYVQEWAYLFYVRNIRPLRSISELWADFTEGKSV